LGLARLTAFLHRHRRIALDSNILIYAVEQSPVFGDLAAGVFRWLDAPRNSAVVSTLTFLEVSVAPYRDNCEELVDSYYGLFKLYPQLDCVPVTIDVADLAAQLRAEHQLKTPDAIVAATAIRSGATALVTNDPVFDRVAEFETLLLERYA